MTTFNDRQKAFEQQYIQNEELRFRVSARARKLLGLWAAHKKHLSEEASLEYALGIVKYGIENTEPGAVIQKVMSDLHAAGLDDVTEERVREKREEMEDVAKIQLAKEVD